MKQHKTKETAAAGSITLRQRPLRQKVTLFPYVWWCHFRNMKGGFWASAKLSAELTLLLFKSNTQKQKAP